MPNGLGKRKSVEFTGIFRWRRVTLAPPAWRPVGVFGAVGRSLSPPAGMLENVRSMVGVEKVIEVAGGLSAASGSEGARRRVGLCGDRIQPLVGGAGLAMDLMIQGTGCDCGQSGWPDFMEIGYWRRRIRDCHFLTASRAGRYQMGIRSSLRGPSDFVKKRTCGGRKRPLKTPRPRQAVVFRHDSSLVYHHPDRLAFKPRSRTCVF